MKRKCTLDHNFICCRKGRQDPPPLTLVNFTKNEETERMGGKWCFWFSKPCSSLFRTVFKLLIFSNTILNSSFFSTWIEVLIHNVLRWPHQWTQVRYLKSTCLGIFLGFDRHDHSKTYYVLQGWQRNLSFLTLLLSKCMTFLIYLALCKTGFLKADLSEFAVSGYDVHRIPCS